MIHRKAQKGLINYFFVVFFTTFLAGAGFVTFLAGFFLGEIV